MLQKIKLFNVLSAMKASSVRAVITLYHSEGQVAAFYSDASC